MQADQPWCIYCGGSESGTSVDHMPPITIFTHRLRLKGMEYLTCDPCHQGSRALDQVAGLLCRMYPNDDTPGAKQELKRIFAGIGNNFPKLLLEMAPPANHRAIARRAQNVLPGAAAAFTIGPTMHALITRFSARVALALHYELCREIVPAAGAVLVRWHTNASLVDGTFPADFAEMLGPPQSLRQGKKSLEEQFAYSSLATEDKGLSAHLATFRRSFALQTFVSRRAQDLPPLAEHLNLVFKPGFLQETLSVL